jgi:nitroreductase
LRGGRRARARLARRLLAIGPMGIGGIGAAIRNALPLRRPASDLERAIRGRRSIRRFLPRPVPTALIEEALELAQHAPSNSNIQPWQMVFVVGAARDRVAEALLVEARRHRPNVPKPPPAFQHHRYELGARVYGSMGIARGDAVAREAAVARNFEFFGAPLAGFVCMHRDLGLEDAVGVGMYLQTLVLVLTARGVGTCVQVALAGYPEIVHAMLGIPAELSILCGISIGYPDPDFPANRLRIARNPVEKNVVFHDR